MSPKRFSQVTENDHAGVIWIISLLGLVYSILTFLTRAAIKWQMLGPDDFALVAAQVLAFGQYGALFVSLKAGLGKASEMLTEHSRTLVSQAAFASQIFVIITLALSKCSVIFLIRRVFTRDMKHFWLICNIFLGIVGVWGITSCFLIGAGCHPSDYVPPNGNRTCPAFSARWIVVVTIDVITEVSMVLLPLCFLWTLQMAASLKSRVVVAFAFRLPVAVFSAVFVHLFIKDQDTPNPGVSISNALVWQQVAVSYSLISATIPTLKSFIKSFDTNFGMGEGSGSGPFTYAGGSGGHSHSSQARSGSHPSHLQSDSYYQKKQSSSAPPSTHDAIKLKSLRPRRSATFRREAGENDSKSSKFKQHITKLRPEGVNNHTTVYASGAKDSYRPSSRGSDSSKAGSQELIIRRDVQFDVRSDYVHLHAQQS
ncbi:hypothetical protein CC78DRAFT_567379 [Lojkania enalia]|uniref:Rhodopsin domain-containing protein n=1 Tax=Lojkania enalia TaxID=147567 RepID=A0A9P4KAQ4_9PLEO|nr:hypothetical protein CC78DRAFT_567379 [Didymosphaeria enalia]